MRITNLTNLPAPLVAALQDDYDRGDADISATGLLAPARKAALEELHAAELETDAADLAAILIGKAVHEKIAAKATGELSDKRRLFMKVNGWTISGQTDHVDDEMFTVDGGRVLDYKSTSVSEWRFGLKEERAQQLNIYAEILRTNGYTVTGLAAVLIFKDWSATQARFNADYPPHSIVEVDVPLWPPAEAQAYIMERVLAHQAAQGWACAAILAGIGALNRAVVCGEPMNAGVHTNQAAATRPHDFKPFPLPPCSDEERWLRGAQWAVRKRGNKIATKNWDTEEAAVGHAAELNAGRVDEMGRHHTPTAPYVVESRPGVYNRCEHFCAVGRQGLCSQWESERTVTDGG